MIYMKANWKQTLKEHIVGPTGSVIFHAIAVTLLLVYLKGSALKETENVMVKVMENKDIPIEEIKVPPPEMEDIPEDLTDDLNADSMEFAVDTPTVDSTPVPSTSTATADFNDLAVMSDISSPVVMSGVMQGRSKAGRDAALGRFGGRGGPGEKAVQKALEWLRKNQNANGSWGNGDFSAYTGLGLLTFLAHGETPASDRYGPTVEKAITYLMSQIDDKGKIANVGGHTVYGHAIATYAISEAYGMTRIPILKPAMEKAVQVIIDGQQVGGGWDYDYKAASTRNDSSVSAWQIQALKAAKIAGATNEKLSESLRKSLDGMKQVYRADRARFSYTADSGNMNDGITALGILCHQLNGQGNAQIVNAALGSLADAEPDIIGEKGGGGERWAFYSCYYVTQAKFNAGEAVFKVWQKKAFPELIKTQNPDGSWAAKAGSPEDRGGELSTKTYGTCLSALSLQVIYRFLPTYQEQAVKVEAAPAAEVKAADDVEIDLNIGI
jgi:hypothetical protein